MPWVRFTADFDWKPQASITVGYRAGMEANVTTACATLALAARKAVRLSKRSRDAEPVEVSDDG